MFLIGVWWLFKKIADMDRYHTLRVVLLTAVLSYFVILFFIGYGFTLGNPNRFDCVTTFTDDTGGEYY